MTGVGMTQGGEFRLHIIDCERTQANEGGKKREASDCMELAET
jgi:hypothetical protein